MTHGWMTRSVIWFIAATLIATELHQNDSAVNAELFDRDRSLSLLPQQRRVQSNSSSQAACPTQSLYHCDNPEQILYSHDNDPTVSCDPNTCKWIISLLNPDQKPKVCQGILVTSIEDLSDSLEPCLWWEILYNPEFNPDWLNGTQIEDLWFLVDDENYNDTQWNTTNGTQWNTTDTSTQDNGNKTVTTTYVWVEFDSIVLTYQVYRGAMVRGRTKRNRRVVRRRLQSPESNYDDNSWWWESQDVLLNITTEHLIQELYVDNNTYAGAGAALIVTPVTTSSHRNSNSSSTAMISLAINGQVALAEPIVHSYTSTMQMDGEAEQQEAAVVQKLVEEAFEGDAMNRYLRMLETSNHPNLQQVEQVYQGLPPTIASDSGTSTSNDDSSSINSSGSSKTGSLSWNSWWIFVIVGTAVGLLIFILVITGTYYRYCCFKEKKSSYGRKSNKRASNAASANRNSSTEIPEGFIVESTLRREEEAALPTGLELNASSGQERKHGARVVVVETSPDLWDRDSCTYTPSDTTSVYSYIDGSVQLEEEDQSYSVAPSLLYGRGLPDDHSIQSRFWSVADGFTADGTSDVTSIHNRDNHAANIAPYNIPQNNDGRAMANIGVSPTGMRHAEATGRVLVFSGLEQNSIDTDDDLSLMSDLHATTIHPFSPPPLPVSRSATSNHEDSMGIESEEDYPISQILQSPDTDVIKDEQTLDDDDEYDRNSSYSKSFSLPPETSDNSSTQTPSFSDDDNDISSEIDRTLDVPTDEDNNINCDELLAMKKRRGKKRTSVRVRKKDVAQSKEQPILQNQVNIAASAGSTSDDESSLFMGPENLDVTATTRITHLSTEDKIDEATHDEFRYGPLLRGRSFLTEKEKTHMHTGETRQENYTGSPFPIPRQLKTSEEKKDDISMSSIGSKDVDHKKYVTTTVASF